MLSHLRSLLKRTIIFAYLLVFCLVHAIHFWEIIETVAEDRLILTLIFNAVVPVLAAVSVALYAINVTPKRYVRFWQTVPCLTFFYVLISLRIDFDALGESHLSVAFVATVIGLVLLYGPAIYMSYKLGGSRPYWTFPPAEKAPGP